MILSVVSDSHGYTRNLREMLVRQRALPASQRPEMLLCLGDGVADPERVGLAEEFSWLAVRGNCDGLFAADLPIERTLCLGGYRIVMMHGHTFGVKSSLVSAMAHAMQEDADLLLYGHTHEPYAAMVAAGTTLFGAPLKKPLYIFNPGALAEGCFGIVELSEKGIAMSHGAL